MLTRVLTVVLLLFCCVQPADAQQVVRLHPTGAESEGNLARVQEAMIGLANGKDVVLKDLYSYGALHQRANRSWVVLRHGEVIVAEQLRPGMESVEVRSLLWKPVAIAWDDVRAIIRNVPKPLSSRDRLLDEIFRTSETSYVILNDETRINATWSFTEDGSLLLERVDTDTPLSLPITSVQACVSGKLIKEDTAKLDLAFSDGSHGAAKEIRRDGRQLMWQTQTGVTLTTEEPLFVPDDFNAWEQLTYLRPRHDDLVYLDELEGVDAVTLPFFDGALRSTTAGSDALVGLGRNVRRGWLRNGSSTFHHGVGMTSLTRASFKVPAGASAFVSAMAVDTVAGRRGSVTFHVFLRRGTGNWESVYSSGVVRGGEVPQRLHVALDGATEIALAVGMADRGRVADYANWLDARFVMLRAR